jgi:hypothetical protein
VPSHAIENENASLTQDTLSLIQCGYPVNVEMICLKRIGRCRGGRKQDVKEDYEKNETS